jgi:prepilin-type N-terminal cleavage/methylation domain-containing protein
MHIRARPRLHLKSAAVSGFTLFEVLIAVTVVAVFMCATFTALTQINRYANSARLRTLALAVAQQRIDEVLTVPWSAGGAVPSILSVGTQTETDLPLNNDPLNSQAGLSSAYTGLDVQVNATRTTAVTSVSTRTLRAVVTVAYTYRSRNFLITLTTLRATDTI